MKSSAGFKIALPFALALLGLVSLGVLSYQRLAEQRESQRQVSRTLVVFDALEKLQSLQQDILGGARGFVLSGDEEFLQPYFHAANELPLQLDALRAVTRDNPFQQQRLRDLEPLIAGTLRAAEELVLRYERDLVVGDSAKAANAELDSTVTKLNREIEEMKREEEKLLKFDLAAATAQARRLANVIYFFAGFAALAVVLVALALWRDFSARRRFEAALAESDARNRAILDTALDGIITVDDKGILKSVNPAAQVMFGYTDGEMVGKKYSILIAESNRVGAERLLAGYIETGRGVITTGQEEIGRRKDGSEFPFEYSVGETQFTGGRHFTAIIRDITRRKRFHQTLRESMAKLVQSNRDLEGFAAIAAHDMQEPLRKIQIFGDRLAQNCSALLSEQGRDYLSRMVNAAARMRLMVNDLLELSRVTAKTTPLTPVNLGRIADELVTDLEIQLTQSGGRIEIEWLPTIEADALQMRQLMQNLIGNALKYRRPDEPPVVKLSGHYQNSAGEPLVAEPSAGGFCQIRVEDNGIGFDEKYLDRIFNPFQRLHGRGQYEGSGIGLAICRRIVERHGGSITATSVPGRGSAFIVKLPLKHPAEKNYYGEAA